MQDQGGRPGVRLHRVAHGAAALAALRDLLTQRRGGDPLAPATVVVTAAAAGAALRRELAARPPGVAGVRVATFGQVAELLGGRAVAAQGRTPLTPPLRREHVRLALASTPGALARVAAHPATARLVERATAELRGATASGEDEEAVLSALEEAGQLPRTLAALHRTLRQAVSAAHYDEVDLTLSAALALQRDPRAARDVGPVVLYLPAPLDPAQARLVRALSAHVGVDALIGVTGDGPADARAARVAATLSPAPPPPTTPPPPPEILVSAPPRTTPPPPPETLVSAPDADEEVRTVVRAIAALLRDGEPLDRVGVLYGEAEPYASLAAEHLAAAGIPVNGPVARTLGQSLPGRVLLDLLALPDAGFGRQAFADWLAIAPLHTAQGPVPADRWAEVAEAAGVGRGREQWARRLRAYAARCDDPGAAADAEALLAFTKHVFGLLDGPADTSWQGFSGWAGELLDACLAPSAARATWPAEDRAAEAVLRERVAALAALDAAGTTSGGNATAEATSGGNATAQETSGGNATAQETGGGSPAAGGTAGGRQPNGHPSRSPRPLDVAAFRRALAAELAEPAGRVGRPGVGVLLAPLDAAPTLALDRAFVLGMAEGALPSRPPEQPLLPDAVRRLLRANLPASPAAWALPTRAERVEEQRHALFAVLGAAAHVTVSRPRGDRRQRRERAPSGWFLELAGRCAELGRPLLADELRVLAREATAPWYRSIPSVSAGIEHAAEPATRSEWVARDLLATLRRGEDVHAAPVVAGDPALLAAVSAVRQRAAAAFTVWDGNVGPGPALEAHLARRHAPTVLARYGTCPRQYFLSSVLGVRERESREDPFALEGSRRGILLHGILERVLRSFAATPPATLDAARAVLRRATDQALGGDHEAASTSLRARLSQEAVRAWLERWLHEHTALAAELGVRPVAAEVAFGAETDPLGPVRVALPSGREVSFRGRVDRLDATPAGDVVLVVDYKTTSDERYRGIEADPVLGGEELQLAVYGLAAAQRHPGAEIAARYWFLGPRTSRAGQRGFVFDAERRERTVAVLDVLTEGVAAGSFPPRPGEWNEFRQAHEHCRSCVFDRICPSSGEREREWRRAAAAPEVLPYAALVEASR